jgi:hypothetical protein
VCSSRPSRRRAALRHLRRLFLMALLIDLVVIVIQSVYAVAH